MKSQKLIGIAALLCLCTVLIIGYIHAKQPDRDKKEHKITIIFDAITGKEITT